MASKIKGVQTSFNVVLNRKTFHIDFKTSQRKSYSLKVMSSNSAELRGPLKTTVAEAEKIVLKHGEWLVQKCEQMTSRDQLEHFDQSQYSLFYCGRPHVLRIETASHTPKSVLTYREEEDLFIMQSSLPNLAETEWYLNNFYKKRAEQMVRLSLESYLEKFERQPQLIQIKDQKARWGSCNQKRQIRLNFRIAQCSQALCDYLVLHELCHMVHMDHSQAFWSLVASHMPDYKKRRAALKGYAANRLLLNLQKSE